LEEDLRWLIEKSMFVKKEQMHHEAILDVNIEASQTEIKNAEVVIDLADSIGKVVPQFEGISDIVSKKWNKQFSELLVIFEKLLKNLYERYLELQEGRVGGVEQTEDVVLKEVEVLNKTCAKSKALMTLIKHESAGLKRDDSELERLFEEILAIKAAVNAVI
jgi:hypothetical protein